MASADAAPSPDSAAVLELFGREGLTACYEPAVDVTTGATAAWLVDVAGPAESRLSDPTMLRRSAAAMHLSYGLDELRLSAVSDAMITREVTQGLPIITLLTTAMLDTVVVADDGTVASPPVLANGPSEEVPVVLCFDVDDLYQRPEFLGTALDALRRSGWSLGLLGVGSGPHGVTLVSLLLPDLIIYDRSIIEGSSTEVRSRSDALHSSVKEARAGALIAAPAVHTEEQFAECSRFGAHLAFGAMPRTLVACSLAGDGLDEDNPVDTTNFSLADCALLARRAAERRGEATLGYDTSGPVVRSDDPVAFESCEFMDSHDAFGGSSAVPFLDICPSRPSETMMAERSWHRRRRDDRTPTPGSDRAHAPHADFQELWRLIEADGRRMHPETIAELCRSVEFSVRSTDGSGVLLGLFPTRSYFSSEDVHRWSRLARYCSYVILLCPEIERSPAEGVTGLPPTRFAAPRAAIEHTDIPWALAVLTPMTAYCAVGAPLGRGASDGQADGTDQGASRETDGTTGGRQTAPLPCFTSFEHDDAAEVARSILAYSHGWSAVTLDDELMGG